MRVLVGDEGGLFGKIGAMRLQTVAEIRHVGVHLRLVEAHAAQHVTRLARCAVDRETGRIRPAMLLRVHQLHKVFANLARSVQNPSCDSAHIRLP